MRRSIPSALALVLLAAAGASAHDFWIKPSTFRPAPGSSIEVALEIGHPGEEEPYARNPQRIERFVIAGPGTGGPAIDISGAPGAHPAGATSVAGPGLYVIAYDSTHARSELPAEKFESYLEEEGLEHAIAARAAEGASEQPGKEIYSRCAKSIVRAAEPGHESQPDHQAAMNPLGMRLELIPQADPTTLAAGSTLKVVLLFDGKPVEGVKVEAMPIARPHSLPPMRTAADGSVSFTIDHAGPWMLHAVHIFDAPKASGARWESLWASLTFDAPQAAAASRE